MRGGLERWKRGVESQGVRQALSYALKGTCDSHLRSAGVDALAGYLTDRRDKRRITFAVVGAYLAAALYALVGHSAGLPASKLVLESLEAMAMVVVVAHVAGGVAQRAVAQRTVAGGAVAQRPSAQRASVQTAPADAGAREAAR